MELMSEKRIKDLFHIKYYELKKARNGHDYLVLFLSLPGLILRGHVWNNCEQIMNLISKASVVEVEGVIKNVYEQPILIISNIVPYEKDSIEVNTEDHLDRLISLILNIENIHCRKLISLFIGCGDFLDKFTQLPAGLTVHHNRYGGLIQHTVSVMNQSYILCEQYKKTINKDLLLTGAFLHDIGKTLELSHNPEYSYTTEGKLLGHIHLGIIIVKEKISMIEDFPKDLALAITHMIASHHGTRYGSEVMPKTPEAMILHRLDGFDIMMDRIRTKRVETEDNGWSKYDNVLKTEVHFLNL